MKKILSVILAVAMVLGCVAALAFVIDPGTSTTTTNSAFSVEDFHVTDSNAFVGGVRVYSDLANMNDAPYSKNSVIRFAVDMTVKNPSNPANGVVPTAEAGDKYELYFESKTVDFGLSTAVGGMALYVPYTVGNAAITNLVDVKLTSDTAKVDATWTPATGILKVPVVAYTRAAGTPTLSTDNVKDSGFLGGKVWLNGQSNLSTVVKTDFTLVLTGVTTGELTDEGKVELKVLDQEENAFTTGTPSTVYVTKNGRTYYVEKWTSNNNIDTTPWWKASNAQSDKYGSLYNTYAATYYIGLVDLGANGKLDTTDKVNYIAGFETEVVEYTDVFGDLAGHDVPNVGKSLGLVYWGGDYNLDRVVRQTLLGVPKYYDLDDSGVELFTVDGKVNNVEEMVGTMTRRAALEQLMSDFNFSFDINNTYKITDSIFTSSATYDVLFTATYNGNALPIPQDPEEDDVQEGTDDEEIPDEGDIDEEIPDEGDIDEDIPGDVEPEPVPETGDASTAVAIALTAAALVAATGFAVVMKKAR